MSYWLAHRGRLLDNIEISIEFQSNSRGKVTLTVLVWKLPVLALKQESIDVNAREVQLRITTFNNHCSVNAER
jgi:hypothetical protein